MTNEISFLLFFFSFVLLLLLLLPLHLLVCWTRTANEPLAQIVLLHAINVSYSVHIMRIQNNGMTMMKLTKREMRVHELLQAIHLLLLLAAVAVAGTADAIAIA